MADIRIKDLTTTASSTASDDFIAVDGATNGTRKLNAYSPSFGGNATVTGTLTVNGGGVFTRANNSALAIASGDAGSYTDISLGRTAGEHFLAIAGSANNYVTGTVAGDCALNASSATAAIFVGVYGSAIGKFTSSGLSIPTTTASTSTSTGALVVSGGVGVAGNLNIGGELQISSAYPAFKLTDTNSNSDFTILNDNGRLAVYDETNAAYRLTIGATGGVKIGTTPEDVGANNLTVQGTLTVSAGSLVVDHVGSSSPTLSLSANGSVQSRFFANGSNTFLESYTNTPLILRTNQTTALTITTGQQVQVNSTTASTSTSTGALVVSGGVGVAGAIYAGGTIRVVGSSHTLRFRQDSAIIDFNNTAENAYVAGTISGNTLELKGNNGTGLTIGTTGNATFAGNITTAAPAGGTAAAWKLGTVASVSPTSPNRTIEVDIGGTIYYIHAKTTNN